MKKRIDLLNGNILVSLSKLAIPIVATSLIQMAYNMTDMIWVARLGSNAVAAVGTGGMYAWLSSALAVLARTGGQVKTAHSLGAGDRETAGGYAKNAIQMGVFFSVILSIVILIFTKPLISFFNLNSAEVINGSETYLRIVGGAGLIFTMVNQIMTGLITATGNSKAPFAVTTVGLVMNIALDPLMIFGFNMGVSGAAWATVIAQAVVTALYVLYAMRDELLFHSFKLFSRPELKKVREIVRIGLPMAIQSMIFTMISMVIARLVAGWGDAAVAAQKIGVQIESISWMAADGFAVAINSFVAQNYGAKNFHRAKKGFATSFGIMTVWSMICTFSLIFLASPIFSIFINEPIVLSIGVDYLIILGFSQFFMCTEIITSGAFSGYGKTLPPSLVSIVFTAMRIPLAMLLSETALGLNGIWWSITISSIIKGVILIMWFLLFIRKYDKKTVDKVR